MRKRPKVSALNLSELALGLLVHRIFLISAISLVWVPAATFASSPKLGDTATYLHSIIVNGKTQQFEVKKTIIEVDEARDLYLVHNYNEAHETKTWMTRQELGYIEDTLAYCDEVSSASHRTEKVLTPAGELFACRVEKSDSSGTLVTWYSADVPFGFVKDFRTLPMQKSFERVVTSFAW
jgi:hypothetical protein